MKSENKTRKEDQNIARIVYNPLARRIFILFLISIIMIGVSVYMGIIPTNKSIMLKHLEEKYGQEFEGGRVGKEGFIVADGDYFMFACPKGGDRETDSFRVEMSTDKKRIEDGYFGILIRKDVEAEALAACADLQLPMKSYYNPSTYYDNIFDGTKTYADYKKWNNEGSSFSKLLKVTIAVPMDGTDNIAKEKYAEQVLDRLAETSLREAESLFGVDVRFYPSEVFEMLTRKNIFDLYKVNDEYALFSAYDIRNHKCDAVIREDVEGEVFAACSDMNLSMKVYFSGASYPNEYEFNEGNTYADLKKLMDDGKTIWINISICIFVDDFNNIEKEYYAKQVFSKIKDGSGLNVNKDGGGMSVDVHFFPTKAFEKITLTNIYQLAKQYPDEYVRFH